ncbi:MULTISPECIES: TonB-dependent siderophore receptor [unclassified Pseudomonas]|uniref:TonB-dependent siderophore receptor n=1 Tax=unclassified Pseudomonas TaxID=196821 RepID=UPI0031332786
MSKSLPGPLNPLAKALLIRHSLRPRHVLSRVGLGLALSTAMVAQVQAQAQEWALDIPAQSMNSALQALAKETDTQLLYSPEDIGGLQSSALKGRHDLATSLRILLGGSGLRYQIDGNTVTVTAGSAAKDGQVELSATNVNSVGLDATTEGTGSYTTGVTSTATKMNLSLRETPQSITVVTRQRMDDQHLGAITDVLKQTPGITISQDGGERFNVYSRGSAIDTYQFDGVNTSQENQTRNMPSTLLDMALYDRVEIVRGATGLMTGAGEPGGVINLIRKKPTHEFKSYIKGSVGSWDNYRSEADVSGPLTETGNVRGRMVAAKQDNHTFMDWYDQKREIFYGVVEADVTDTTLVRFGVDYQKYRSTGSPGVPLLFTNGKQTDFSRSTSSGARWMYDDFETMNYTATLEQQLVNDWKLRVVANYMDVDRDADLGWYRSTSGVTYLNEATGSASAERAKISADQTQKGLDVNLAGTYDLFGRSHDLVLGYNYSEYENDHRSQTGGIATFNFYTWDNYLARDGYRPSLIFNIKTRQSGYYVANRFNVTDDLHLLLGARVSQYTYDSDLTSLIANTNTVSKMRETGQVTPYAGLIYDLTPEQSVYFSYTDIFKPQTSMDKDGKVLEPVVGKNYEAGWKGEFFQGRLNTSAAVFMVERDNFAELDPGQLTPTGSSAYRAVDGAKTKGFDLEVTGEIAPGWNVQTGYSHAKTKDADGERLTTQLPMDTFRLWTTYHLKGDWDKLTIGGGVNWDSSKSLTFTNINNAKAKDDDYAVVNLMARYQVTEHLAATVNVNNLFDEKYYSGMAGSYGHYGAPRNATLDVRYDF